MDLLLEPSAGRAAPSPVEFLISGTHAATKPYERNCSFKAGREFGPSSPHVRRAGSGMKAGAVGNRLWVVKGSGD
jgi:hypothetical protein